VNSKNKVDSTQLTTFYNNPLKPAEFILETGLRSPATTENGRVTIRKFSSKIKAKSGGSIPLTNADDNNVDLTFQNGIQV
jgi:hypothetical protein